VEDEGDFTGLNPIAAFGHQPTTAVHGDGYDRRLGFDGHRERTGTKRKELAVGAARALGKNKQRDSSAQAGNAGFHGAAPGFAVRAVDVDEAAQAHDVAEYGNPAQGFLQNDDDPRQGAEQRGRVEIADVVTDEDRRGRCERVFEVEESQPYSGKAQSRVGSDLRHAVDGLDVLRDPSEGDKDSGNDNHIENEKREYKQIGPQHRTESAIVVSYGRHNQPEYRETTMEKTSRRRFGKTLAALTAVAAPASAAQQKQEGAEDQGEASSPLCSVNPGLAEHDLVRSTEPSFTFKA